MSHWDFTNQFFQVFNRYTDIFEWHRYKRPPSACPHVDCVYILFFFILHLFAVALLVNLYLAILCANLLFETDIFAQNMHNADEIQGKESTFV